MLRVHENHVQVSKSNICCCWCLHIPLHTSPPDPAQNQGQCVKAVQGILQSIHIAVQGSFDWKLMNTKKNIQIFGKHTSTLVKSWKSVWLLEIWPSKPTNISMCQCVNVSMCHIINWMYCHNGFCKCFCCSGSLTGVDPVALEKTHLHVYHGIGKGHFDCLIRMWVT